MLSLLTVALYWIHKDKRDCNKLEEKTWRILKFKLHYKLLSWCNMTMLWNNTSGQQKICKEKTLNKSKETKCMFAMYSMLHICRLHGMGIRLAARMEARSFHWEKQINKEREVEGELVSIIHNELIVMIVTFTVLQYFVD